MKATAQAQANIAFVKYWGKRDLALNLPAAGSLSLTLAGLSSTTTVTFLPEEQGPDQLTLDGQPTAPGALAKISKVLEQIRRRADLQARAEVVSANNFPTGAGLASSASGLAALTVAAAQAAGLSLLPEELSAIARQGSGSACRSIFGGYVEWQAGGRPDGSDSVARCLFPPEHWELRALVAVISAEKKAVDSTQGMIGTGQRSPYHQAFVQSVPDDLSEARAAIGGRDLERLARVAERSCLRMHAAMMASDPPLIYLKPASWQVIERVLALRQQGLPAFFTADAGPNVKVFCEPPALAAVQAALGELPGVLQIINAAPGPGAQLLCP